MKQRKSLFQLFQVRACRSILLLGLLLAAGCADLLLKAPGEPDPLEAARQAPVRFDPPSKLEYRFDHMYFMPQDRVSNPSGLVYGGRLPDESVVLYVVCDGSAIVRDRFDPLRTVVRVVIDPQGNELTQVSAVPVDSVVRPCDLEAIAIDPNDGNLLIADERVARNPECGGGGPDGAARSQIFKLSPEGKLIAGPWDTEVLNRNNDGIEGLATYRADDGTHVLVFQERTTQGDPEILEYRILEGNIQGFELLRRLSLKRGPGVSQADATFRRSDGVLLLLDRNRIQLLEVDFARCLQTDGVDCFRVASMQELIITHLGLSVVSTDRARHGVMEGIASDDQDRIYIALDNNSTPYQDGDSRPRLLRFSSYLAH